MQRMVVCAVLAVFGIAAWGEPSRCTLGEAKFMSWAPRTRPWTLKAGLLHLDAKQDIVTTFEFNRKNDARFVSGFSSGPRFRISFAYRATAKATLRLGSAPMDTPVEGVGRQTKDLSPVTDWTDVVWEPKVTALDRYNVDLSLACEKGTGYVEVKNFAVTDVAPEDRSGKSLLVNGSRVTEICLYETDTPRRRLNDLRAALMFRYAMRQAGGEWLPVRTVAKTEEAGANAVLVGRLAVDAGVVEAAEQAKVEGLTGGWATAAKGTRLGLAGAVPCGVQRGAWRVLERLGIVYLGSDLFKPFAGKAFETGDFVETKIPAIAFHTCREDYRSGLNDELRGQVSRDCLIGAHAIGSVPERSKLAEDSLGFIVPVSEFRESHPEYFALQKDGTRLTDDAHSKGLTHYCWTAPGLAELIAARYLEMMRALPEQAVWILAPGDGGGCNCTCANCRALGSDSDGLVRLANRVAEVISKEFPENSILIYSYVDTPEPPTNPVKAHPNLNIGYCVYPTEYWPSCMIHPHPSNEKGMKALAGWRRECQPRMGLFGYFQQCGEWMDFWPGFDADVWMMRDFAEHRAFMTWIWGLTPTHRGWINETSGFTDLTIYVLSRLAVDPSLDARKMATEFIDCFYGASAKPMRRVFDLATAEPRKRDWVQNCEQHKPGFVTKAFADEVMPLLDEAERLAGDDAALSRRIRKQTILFYWTYLNGINRGNGSVSAAELKTWAQRAARFVRACKANGSWYFQAPKRWFHDKLMLDLTTSGGWEENWMRAPEIAELLEDPEKTLGRKLENRQTSTKDGFLIPATGMTGGEFGPRKLWQIDLRIVRRPTSGMGIVMTRLDLAAVPKGKVTMFLTGVDNNHAPVAEIRVKVNDTVVYAGPVKWGKKGHSEWAIEIPSGVLQAGENEIIVQNTTADTEKDGEGGDRFRAKRNYYWGWFMLDSIRFAFDANIEAKAQPHRAAEIVWTDGTNLPVAGKVFTETPTPWSRLPVRFKDKVSANTWNLMGQSAGLYYSFTTTANRVSVRWSLAEGPNVMPQMADVGSSGLDVYARQADGTWRHLAAGRPKEKDGNEMTFRPQPGAAHRVYLPLCNGVRAISFGVEAGKRLFPYNEHAGKKPIVIYGGSVVQGACVSRPGLAWTSQLGRILDAPIVNLGCSGQGVMTDGDLEMLAEADAGGFVLMTLGNMKAETWSETYERFVRTLESRKPRLPMVLCSWHYPMKGKCSQDAVLEAMKLKLASEDGNIWSGMLHIVPNGDLCPADGDSTVDGGHPNDYGARVMARAVAAQAEVAFPTVKRLEPVEGGRARCP